MCPHRPRARQRSPQQSAYGNCGLLALIFQLKKADCWAGRLGIQRATESTAAIEQTTFGLLDSLDVGQNPGTIEVGLSRTVEAEVGKPTFARKRLDPITLRFSLR